MGAAKRKDVVATVFCEYAQLIQLRGFYQYGVTERSGGAVIKRHADVVGAWKVLGTQPPSLIIAKPSDPLKDFGFPTNWEIVMLHGRL